MNKREPRQPAIYGLRSGGVFGYVGKTTTNAKTRWWEHRSRAKNGHEAPVYVWMREVGVETVEVVELEQTIPENLENLEVVWIAKLMAEGHPLQNQFGLDGKPNSWSPATKEKVGSSRRGKPTWIKGKTGEEAGWTEERRESMRLRAKEKVETRVPNHGTINEYSKYGCRCEECRTAGARANAKSKGVANWESVTVRPLDAPTKVSTHGTVQSYKRGLCRCEPCKTAYREYKKSLPKLPKA